LVLCEGGDFSITREFVLHFNIVFSINRFSFNCSGKEVDILESFSDIVSVETKSRDRVGEQFTSILYESYLFLFNESKYSLDSFDISGFVSYFISPFDGITNKCGSTFNNVHNFIGGFGSGLNSSNHCHWINHILQFLLGGEEVVLH